MKNQEDLNKYSTSPIVPAGRTEGEFTKGAVGVTKTLLSMFLKGLKTVFFVGMLSGTLVLISVMSYILSFKDTEPPNISDMTLNLNSTVYQANSETGEWETAFTLHSADEQRIFVPYDEIPRHFIDAVVAIEDKRFWKHDGVDLRTTANAVLKMFGGSGGGGSTITQQLIKNVTENDENSIMRKVKEIFTAINLRKVASREEVLEAYLNVVNFGGNYQGIEAAAKAYFGKSVRDCDVVEAAAIVGITQYPYKYNPLINPENNKDRRDNILREMYFQGYLNEEEYAAAKERSNNLTFPGAQKNDEEGQAEKASFLDWYDETMYEDLIEDIMELKGYSYDNALHYLKTAGLEIYSAKNKAMQDGVQNILLNEDVLPYDPEVDLSFFAMDFNGRVLAVVGGRGEKVGDRVFNNATQGLKGPGSSIKPISVYAPAIENNSITYGTIRDDNKIPDFYGKGDPGPSNYTKGAFVGPIPIAFAVARSHNTVAARVLLFDVGVENAYNFLVNQLHFKNLTEVDSYAPSSLSMGSLDRGTTAKEMTAGFQVFGNQGIYNEPYTYYYVKDKNGDVILDNRNKAGERALSPESATIMNKLLHEPVNRGTATAVAYVADDVWGKTGTTDNSDNIWFVGGTSKFVAGVWNGYSTRDARLSQESTAKTMWAAVAEYLMNNFEMSDSGYSLSENVIAKRYCEDSGLIAGSGCSKVRTGWYSVYNIPDVCNGGYDHLTNKNIVPESTPAPTPTVEPTETIPPENPDPQPVDPNPEPTEQPVPEHTLPPVPTPEPTIEPQPTPEPQNPEPPPSTEPTQEHQPEVPAG